MKSKEIADFIKFVQDEVTSKGGKVGEPTNKGSATKIAISDEEKRIAYTFTISLSETRTLEQMKKAFRANHARKLGQ